MYYLNKFIPQIKSANKNYPKTVSGDAEKQSWMSVKWQC